LKSYNFVSLFRKEIQEINWERKTTQTNTGERLKQLESSWVGLVSKNYEIERACIELEKLHEEYKTEIARKEAMNVDSKPPTPPPTYENYYESTTTTSTTPPSPRASQEDGSDHKEPGKSDEPMEEEENPNSPEEDDEVVGPKPISYESVADEDVAAGVDNDNEKYAAQAEMDAEEEDSDDDDEDDASD